jgi:hypothetical protein
MSAQLDELHRQLLAMMRDGLRPTGLVIEHAMLKAIGATARANDPRIEWSDEGPVRLFGFRPQFVLSAPARFTYPPRLARERDFTLRDLRAL